MIKAKKSFGQNFLKDEGIINKIVSSIDFSEGDLIIEIGPGMGALTSVLKNNGARVVAFEIDQRMHDYLDKLQGDNVQIIYEDILKVDLESVLSKYKYKKLYVIANLPYYITTPIVEKLISMNIKIDQMTIMVQNEVADRFCAKPGTSEYGMMTVILNYKYELRKLFIVDKNCFNPAPKVQSAVVNLKLKDNIENVDMQFFKNFISMAFSHKRKTLKNNIGNELYSSISDILTKYNLSPNVRAEEIPLDAYIQICNKLTNKS